jgi:lysophospholipase L1-like esterase
LVISHIAYVDVGRKPDNSSPEETVEHIVLIGDSIFANKSYVGNEQDVISHLRAIMPKDWTATLCAIDGSFTHTVPAQLQCIPKEATQIVLSIGGNDALTHQDLLYENLQGSRVLSILADAADEFGINYEKTVQMVRPLGKSLCLCTIYNGNLPKEISQAAKAAIAVFNDRIYAVANDLKLPVIDLRRVCTETTDYANPIEPSGAGGAKIAKRILEHVQARITPATKAGKKSP